MTRFEEYMGSLLIQKALRVNGDFTVLGDFTFGDASTDTLTVSGDIVYGASTADYAIDINAATPAVADIRLSNGTTIVATSAAETTITEATLTLAASVKLDVNGMLDVSDELAGGVSNGNIIKKTLQAGEAYTGTTAGLMIKNYGTDGTETVPSGEFCGAYISLKGLHVDPGHNTSIISAHVHASNTTTVWAGLWLYGDLQNGIKMSGSTVVNALDISEATAVTNLMTLPAAGTDPVIANALVPSAAPDAGTVGADACLRVLVNDVAYYIALYDTLHA